MNELFDFKTRKKITQETIPTPEKSKEEMYLDALKAEREVLAYHYAMSQLRRGKKIEEMSDSDLEDYKSYREAWQKSKEVFLSTFNGLDEDDQEKSMKLTNLHQVQLAISLLEKPEESDIEKESSPAPKNIDQIKSKTPETSSEDQPAVEETVNLDDAENPDRGLTMTEVERMLKYARITARPLETAYWEKKKAELLQRQEAEANPDRPVPKGFLQRVKDGFAKGFSKGKDSFSKFSLKRKEGGPTDTTTPPQESEREPIKESKWGWLKERGKGLISLGFWELKQAERFRRGTKEVAQQTKELAEAIQQETNLSEEEAQAEAEEIAENVERENIGKIELLDFYRANKDIIRERKRNENDQVIESIIRSAGNDLVEKLAKYKGESGQDVLTEENRLAFEADLRGELNKIRDGAFRKDFVNFAKLMRRNLDDNWRWRYVWGTAEALLWTGVGWFSWKFLVAKKAAAAIAGGAEGTRKFVETGMHENVWNTLKEMAQNGPQHLNLDNSVLQEVTQKTLDANGMFEKEWINQIGEGLRSSRTLPEGFPIKIPVEVMKVLGH